VTRRRLHPLAAAACATALAACQPETRRVLVLDLGLTDPAALAGTATPWLRAGYDVDYRRFYPHPTRTDAARYRVLLLLGGRAPEAPSDALRPADLALLSAWVAKGGVLVVGYSGDGEGSLDRWTLNRWLDALGAGIAIEDSVLRDTARTDRAGTDPQPWVTARRDGPVGGSALAPFPGGRNHALRAPAKAVLAHAAGAPVMAGARVDDGLVVVMSRHALGALGAEVRPSTAPFLGALDLARTRTFLVALARWTRRPAEWAHVPPTRRARAIDLSNPPRLLSAVPAPEAPPSGATATPLLDTAPAERPALPAWTRRPGFRVLRDDAPMRPGLLPSGRARMLDSVVELMESASLTALWTRAGVTPLADTTRSQQWERDVLRAAWKQMGERLQATSVRWLPGVDLHDSRFPHDTVELDARGDTVAPWAALDPRWWDEAVRPAVRAVARLAAEQQDLVPGIVVDLPAFGMGAGFADPTFRAGLSVLRGDSTLRALPASGRFDSLLERGHLEAFYATLEAAVAQRAATLRQDLRRIAPGRGVGLRIRQPALDWFGRGLIRGLGDSSAAVWLFTDEARTPALGVAVIPVLRLTPDRVPAASWSRLADLVFIQNGGFWLDLERPGPVPDTLAQQVRRLSR
jgi:hypothetical protein